MKIVKIFIFEGRISDCCHAPVIRMDYSDETCKIWCGKCGKESGFEKISQFSPKGTTSSGQGKEEVSK